MEGWEQVFIGDLCEVIEQRAPSDNEEFLYIDIGSIDRDLKVIISPTKMTGVDAPSRARKVVREGDVLVSMTRPSLNAVALVTPNLDGQIASTGFDVLRCSGVEPRWIYFLVRTRAFVGAMSDLVQGALYPAVKAKDIRGYLIPLAPLNEQRRIAAKLDTTLAAVEACRQRLDGVAAILKRFRQAVLAAATSGELTREWREDNPDEIDASSLAAFLKSSHSLAGGHKRGNAAPPTDGVHDLDEQDFPKGWRLVELRDIVRPDRPITYGILKPGPELVDGVPYIRVADYPGNKLNVDGIKKTSFEIDEAYRRSRLEAGDLLLSIRGTVGRLTSIPPELENANITQDSARLSLQEALCASYIEYALHSEILQSRMRRAVKGVAVRGINIGDVRALQVPIPSIQEQEEISSHVELLFTLAEQLEVRLNIARKSVDRLTPALLAKAFRGELVPQDPNDEPASELLARLKARQSKSAQMSPRRRVKQPSPRPPMSIPDKDSIKAAILRLTTDRFSFDELRTHAGGDYESLKVILFELLEEPSPVIRQVFDQEAKAMKLEQVAP